LSNAEPIKQYFCELVMVERVARAPISPACAAMEAGRIKMSDVAAEVISIIANKLPPERRNLAMDDRIEDLGIDSIDVAEIFFDLEEKFDIRILHNLNDALPQFETVGHVVDAITKLVGGKS
jgi:acyl carrier protein